MCTKPKLTFKKKFCHSEGLLLTAFCSKMPQCFYKYFWMVHKGPEECGLMAKIWKMCILAFVHTLFLPLFSYFKHTKHTALKIYKKYTLKMPGKCRKKLFWSCIFSPFLAHCVSSLSYLEECFRSIVRLRSACDLDILTSCHFKSSNRRPLGLEISDSPAPKLIWTWKIHN